MSTKRTVRRLLPNPLSVHIVLPLIHHAPLSGFWIVHFGPAAIQLHSKDADNEINSQKKDSSMLNPPVQHAAIPALPCDDPFVCVPATLRLLKTTATCFEEQLSPSGPASKLISQIIAAMSPALSVILGLEEVGCSAAMLG